VMAITAAEKVLIVGGVLNLAYGMLLGYPIVVIRVKGASATPRYLLVTHISTLLHAAILLGLVWAARLSALGPGWQVAAASLIVASSVLIAAKDTMNWLTGVKDEFSEKARNAPLGVLGALAATVGVGIFVVGVLTAV
jgi:small-conductance mechanosensitive channel